MYAGTKERLLIEVLRGDAEVRVGALDAPLEAAKTADEVLDVFVNGAEEILQSDPGFYVLIFELFPAGRQNPEIRAELAQVYEGSRRHVAEILRRKEAEGVRRSLFNGIQFQANYRWAHSIDDSSGAFTDSSRRFHSGQQRAHAGITLPYE